MDGCGGNGGGRKGWPDGFVHSMLGVRVEGSDLAARVGGSRG